MEIVSTQNIQEKRGMYQPRTHPNSQYKEDIDNKIKKKKKDTQAHNHNTVIKSKHLQLQCTAITTINAQM